MGVFAQRWQERLTRNRDRAGRAVLWLLFLLCAGAVLAIAAMRWDVWRAGI